MEKKQSRNLKEWQQEVLKTYDRIRMHEKPYEVRVGNISLTVLPNVFSPKYFTDSLWFAVEISKIVKNKSFLEIGTGTGIIAVFCALNGVKVVATDINQSAVENAKLNAKKLGLEIDVRQGSIYAPINEGEKFDFIFWNHPFNKSDTPLEDALLMAGFDFNYAHLNEYVKGAARHLNPNGKLLLGTGNFADLNEIRNISHKAGYNRLALVRKKAFPPLDRGVVKNEYRIYHIEKKQKIGVKI